MEQREAPDRLRLGNLVRVWYVRGALANRKFVVWTGKFELMAFAGALNPSPSYICLFINRREG